MELSLDEASKIEVEDIVYYDDGFRYGYNKVLAIDEVFNLTSDMVTEFKLNSSTAWFYPETNEVVCYSDHSENEWGFVKLEKKVLDGAELVNRFFWIEGYDGGHSLPYYEIHTDPKFIESE